MASIGLRPPRKRHPQPPSETPPRRRPLAARCALLSFLWPGLGQIRAGARRRGIALVGFTVLLLVGALALLALQGRDTLIGEAVDTRVLAGVLVADVLIAVYRLGAIADAARLGHRASGTVTTLAILGILVLVPHTAAGWYAYTAYDTVTEVFEEAEPTDVLVPVADEFDAPLAGTTSGGVLAADPASVSAVSRRPEQAAAALPTAAKNLPAWQKRGRLNIVLLGADAGPGRSGLRTDTMMVATIELKTHRAALFSVPRNMGGVPLPPRAARGAGARFPGILNALHGFGTAHPELFPGGKDPGATALKQTLGQLTGLPIDYYVMVDFRGFHGLVDALGGVTLDIPHAVLDRVSPYEKGGKWIRIDLQAGRQHLTADEAFAYVRARSTTSDWARIKRQRCVIAALADATGPTAVLRSFRGLAKTFRENFTTDIPARHLPELARLATSIQMSRVVSIGFTPPDFTSGVTAAGKDMPDIPAIRAAVRDALTKAPAKTDPRTIGGGACI
ncbi:MAG: polyisoprenyl-teichoic acid--peptidoglycan teichoic acid transferase [Gaiellaceae bacterium]|nr:polyisoprenyl-teichoic acid--peptidoglycan teichoic acid transferase [Gaiellaceae bacterium]